MNIRPRRNRKSAAIRNLVEETSLGPQHLIYPLFLKDGKNIKEK
jgi:Delta-aminolevulinic acid dehydratase